MWNSSVLRPLDVPIDTDAAEAQQWAIDELSKSVYDNQPSIWVRAWRWLLQQLGQLFDGAGSMTSSVVVVLIVAALAAAIAIVALYRGRLRRNRAVPGRDGRSAALFDDSRSSADLWADATAAADAGRWSAACLDGFRGIVRSLDERVLLDETPGMTAREAALAGGTIFPELAPGWTRGGELFDALAYGDRAATQSDWNALRSFADEVKRATPARRLVATQ